MFIGEWLAVTCDSNVLELCVKRIPMILPPINESFTSELAHCRCGELCKDCKHNNLVQLDAEV